MGKGDKKSRKGKLIMGSYGKSRPHKVKNKKTKPEVSIKEAVVVAPKKKAAAKKA